MTSYKINRPKVDYEVFEDEIVVINFDNGNYFSLKGSAVEIWKMISEDLSDNVIVQSMKSMYGLNHKEAEEAFGEFIGRLIEDELVCEFEIMNEKNLDLELSYQNETKLFEPPVYEKYTDMSDLLLLDPIHDVDESGWPYVEKK